MKRAIIDLTNCKYLIEMHERINTGLDLEEGYGRNWSAFWDEINRNIKYDFITVKGSETVSKELTGSVEKMHKILERNKRSWAHSDHPFDYEFVD